MESQSHSPTCLSLPALGSGCPFHDGPPTLDALLAELGCDDLQALDLALDLRCALSAGRDAEGCVRLALDLRHALDGAHYLAFYRVRHWLRRIIAVQVRAWRGSWQTFPLPLNSARPDEIENACLAAWAAEHGEAGTALTEVRYVFLAAAPRPIRALDDDGASPIQTPLLARSR